MSREQTASVDGAEHGLKATSARWTVLSWIGPGGEPTVMFGRFHVARPGGDVSALPGRDWTLPLQLGLAVLGCRLSLSLRAVLFTGVIATARGRRKTDEASRHARYVCAIRRGSVRR